MDIEPGQRFLFFWAGCAILICAGASLGAKETAPLVLKVLLLMVGLAMLTVVVWWGRIDE